MASTLRSGIEWSLNSGVRDNKIITFDTEGKVIIYNSAVWRKEISIPKDIEKSDRH